MKYEFIKYLDKTNLLKEEKEFLKAVFGFFEGSYLNLFANRSFIFEGEPGIGKSFLAKKFVKSLNKPTLYLGQSDFKSDNVEKTKNIDALLEKLESFEEGVVYIDDLKFIFDFEDFGTELGNDDRKKLMKLLESFRENERKTILILTLNDSSFLEDSQRDRIDVEINFDLPNEFTKMNYLRDQFGEHVENDILNYLSKNSMGYSYRDLPSVLKLAYFHGESKVTKDSLITALKEYKPSSLQRLGINQGIELRINDLFLKDSLKEKLMKIITLIKEQDKLTESGVSKAKFIIFEGPAGVGKTHTAMALAGELDLPLMKIGARHFSGPTGLSDSFNSVGRFGKAIFLLDDSDKFFGGSAMDLDDGGRLFADLNRHLDEIEEKGGIVIMSANNANRFGIALKNRFDIIRFDYPSEREIKSFFKKLMKKSRVKMDFSEKEFIQYNLGKGFRDMQRFWNECIFYAVHNDKTLLTTNDLNALFGGKKNELNKMTMFG
jgi:AAA+ superfamily predicted ATPase